MNEVSHVSSSSSLSLSFSLNFLISISHWVKKRMLLRLLRGNSLLVIVSQQLIQEIYRLWRHQMLIVRVHKLTPRLPRVSSDQRLQVRIQLNPVLIQIRV